MANSLRAKLSKLRHDGNITNAEYDELIKKLNGHDRENKNKIIDEITEIIERTYHNFGGYDLAFMQKYGNTTARQQHESYSTMMMYEIADEFADLIDNVKQLKGGVK